MDSRVEAKFGEIGRWEVAEKSLVLTPKKLRLRGTRPIPHFAPTGPIAPKFPKRCPPCARVLNLFRIA